MLRLIKYSNPILPPQYCLLRPLCLYLSFPSRRRRPSRDALYARNEDIKKNEKPSRGSEFVSRFGAKYVYLPLSPYVKESVYLLI